MKHSYSEEELLQSMYAAYHALPCSDFSISENQYNTYRKSHNPLVPTAKTIANRFGSWDRANFVFNMYARSKTI